MKQSVLFRICLRNGVVAGILAVILFIGLYYIGRNPLLISPFLDFRVLLLGFFIFFSLKEFREHYQEGLLYFWQGLIGSGVVVISASVLAAFGVWLFGTFEPNLLTSYIEQMTTYLKGFPPEDIERIGKEVYERNLEQLPATNIATLAFTTYLFQGLVIGFFISIILSVILRKTPKL